MGKRELDRLGIDWVCEQITEGKMLREIAREVGCSISAISEWLASPDHSARAREARKAAAAAYTEMAEEGIRNAADPFELAKAKELAHHFRWKAAKMDPKYGDKTQTEITGAEGAPLQVTVQYVSPKRVDE